MVTEAIEMGSVSSRGQIAIPSGMRKELGLEEGSKVLFFLQDDAVIMKKVTVGSFSELTRPFREANKKIKEDDVVGLVHKVRKDKK
jgi:AbrB family looped-hinge helix DNA binding protein